jgi:hypothetical protein
MSVLRSTLRALGLALGWLLLLAASAWTFGALWFDFPVAGLRRPVAIVFCAGALAALVLARPRWRAKVGIALTIMLVAAWWFTLQPRNDRNWQPDVAQEAWAEVNGDVVTLHNVRNFDYRTETDYTPRWETRTVRLSQLTGIDLAINYWGSTWMAHPILSFQFADTPPVAMSIEVRKETGEAYSALGGLYRRFELIFIAADERDVLRLRTNYRKGEDIYLYRTTFTPAQARELFLEYLDSINEIRNHPRWYNAITTNCTTSIRAQRPATERAPWDWRMLLNGKMDELLYELGVFSTDGLSFAELKNRALINPVARAADQSSDFSQRIREARPGFGDYVATLKDLPNPSPSSATEFKR